jgi:hypothetical protein
MMLILDIAIGSFIGVATASALMIVGQTYFENRARKAAQKILDRVREKFADEIAQAKKAQGDKYSDLFPVELQDMIDDPRNAE